MSVYARRSCSLAALKRSSSARTLGSVTALSRSAMLSPTSAMTAFTRGRVSATTDALSDNAARRRSMPTMFMSAPTRASAEVSSSRSEEHTSELQSLMRISYAVFCLKKKQDYNHEYIVDENTIKPFRYTVAYIRNTQCTGE